MYNNNIRESLWRQLGVDFKIGEENMEDLWGALDGRIVISGVVAVAIFVICVSISLFRESKHNKNIQKAIKDGRVIEGKCISTWRDDNKGNRGKKIVTHGRYEYVLDDVTEYYSLTCKKGEKPKENIELYYTEDKKVFGAFDKNIINYAIAIGVCVGASVCIFMLHYSGYVFG